jgi:hypothetical protein
MSPLRKAAASSWKWLLIGLGLALMALLLTSACNGDGGDDGEDGAGETPTAEGTPADDSISEKLRILSERWATKSAKVNYDVSFIQDGSANEFGLVLYWRPPDSRVDIVGQGEGLDTIFIVAGDNRYLCAAGDNEGQCLSLGDTPLEGLVSSSIFPPFSEPDALTKSIAERVPGLDIDTSERTIAGQSASCFSLVSPVVGGEGEAEWCFTDDGIVLLLASSLSDAEASGTFRLEATDISSDLSDADFEPPYPLADLPPGVGTMPGS